MRKLLIETANYWFQAARRDQEKGDMVRAFYALEQSLNHTENALAAALNCLKECSDPKAKEFLDKYKEKGNILPL